MRPDLHRLAVRLHRRRFERIAEATGSPQPAMLCASIATSSATGRLEALATRASLGEMGLRRWWKSAISTGCGSRRARAVDHKAAVTAVESGRALLAVGGDREQALVLAERHGLALANDFSRAVRRGRDAGLKAARPIARAVRPAGREAAQGHRRLSLARHGARLQDWSALLSAEASAVISCATASPFADDPREQLVAGR